MTVITDIIEALQSGWTQNNRFLRISTTLGSDVLMAERLDGWESVDHGGFRLHISALTTNTALAVETAIGTPALLEWRQSDADDSWRPLHGHVVVAERTGHNAGLARVKFVVEPWLAMLHQRVDSYHYQNASVIDISEQIFRYYARGVVAPAWRWALADRTIYAQRSLTVQAGESDFDFLTRLWAEEGLFYWFEHQADAGSTSFGAHTLVLCDTNQGFTPSAPETLPFHQTGESDPGGVITHLMPTRRWRIGQVARASWDYRSLSVRPTAASVQGAVAPGEDRDVAAPYAYPTSALGDRRTQQQLDALRVDAVRSQGDGTRRDLRPGLRFTVSGHPVIAASEAFVCLRVEHMAHANVSADIRSAITQHLGDIPSSGNVDDTAQSALTASLVTAPADSGGTSSSAMHADTDLYANRFEMMPAAQSYRPLAADGHGARTHASAIAPGATTAIVVGEGGPIHTDRDHRIRVQFHTQRGGNAASREAHPHADNAPANASSGTWTRMLTTVGGDNWGGVAIPRVGQEVWVELLEGQPDRPVALGALYNGAGNADAQHNLQAGGPAGGTGNAAAWFAGNTHAAVMSGFKTQDMGQSQAGTGGYRHFLLDDSAGQSRAHLYTTDHASGLTLGHIKQQDDNQRLADRGFGAELTTAAAGALRGGSGLLVSTAAGASQMDAQGTADGLAASLQRMQSLSNAAQAQGAVAKTTQGTSSAAFPAVKAVQDSRAALIATSAGASTESGSGGGGTAVAWSSPHLAMHGADGMLAMSGANHVWLSGKETAIDAGQDLQIMAAGKTSVVAKNGIVLYSNGAAAGGRPVDTRGIALHAATGGVSAQAQHNGSLVASARTTATLTSVSGSTSMHGVKRIVLSTASAFVKMEGSDIEVSAPDSAQFRSGNFQLTGPQGAGGAATLAQSAAVDCPQTMSDMVASSAAYVDL
ncbi:type VI secretion system tip protein VgrG [Paraburkholderia sp. J67]|uniref:type VI secretion system Vgr family protein n=1 Tax=Paraburkholderia sp. J67 TaxID=2805435 RepID=UPI002ABE23F4|nr:type VI secretion system tip protein VgrG [Paraburkholderia sp. J67]